MLYNERKTLGGKQMRYKQRSLDQTGLAVYIMEDGSTKEVPTFSVNPVEEAKQLMKYIKGVKFLDTVFYTCNLMDYKTEDIVKDFVQKKGYLPEDYLDELVSGFPHISGADEENTIGCYE